jgi:very-short-patch-repair endonuclease
MEYDSIRSEFLALAGIHVIRFINIGVDNDFESVCNAIDKKVTALLTNPQ